MHLTVKIQNFFMLPKKQIFLYNLRQKNWRKETLSGVQFKVDRLQIISVNVRQASNAFLNTIKVTAMIEGISSCTDQSGTLVTVGTGGTF